MAAVKKEITFEDLDGNEVTEEWYFRLEEADVVDMDLAHEKDPAAYLKKIVEDHDSRALLALWKELLFRSVGKREGSLLVKRPEYVDEFMYGGAYNKFFQELITSEDIGAEFFTSILPQRIQERVKEEQNRTYTKDELLAMSDEEFDAIAGTDTKNMSQEHFQIAFQRRSQKLGKTA
jgi:hypothetical protein